MKKDKIKIHKVEKEVLTHKGFSEGPMAGCLNCPCGKDKQGGACCRYGCDVDKEAYELIYQNRILIEKELGINLDKVFEKKWSGDKEFLGGNSIRVKKNLKTGYCSFHYKGKKGCGLIGLAMKHKIDWRMIPTICKLYPLTWADGVLKMYGPDENDMDFKSCDCNRKDNRTTKSIWETQKKFIDDIFEIDENE